MMLLRQCHRKAIQRSSGLHAWCRFTRRPVTNYYTLGATRPVVEAEQDASLRRVQSSQSTFLPRRTLATAVDDYPLIPEQMYDNLNQSIPNLRYADRTPPPYYELRPHNISSPLVLQEPSPPGPRPRMNASGIAGDVDELFAVFNACIQVKKFDRAELVLKRLASIAGVDRDELVALHNRYLKSSLDHMRLVPNKKQAEDLHKWYELHIRSKGLPQTAETVACMLKASLLSEGGSRLRRLVLRYMAMAPGDAGLEVLSMADVLTDQDLALITDICPTYNLTSEPDSPTLPDAASDATLFTGSTSTEQPPSSASVKFPDVLATPQKGFGLKLVKQTLSLFDEIPQNCDISTLSRQEQKEIQSRLELDSVDAAVERWREENDALQKMGLNTSLSHASLNSRLYDWQRALEAYLKDELEKVEQAEVNPVKSEQDLERCFYGPFLRQSNPSRLAAVTILSTLSSVTVLGVDRGATLSAVISSIAKLVEEDTRAQGNTEKKPSGQQKHRRNIQRSLTTRLKADAPELPLVEDLAGDIPALAATKPTTIERPWPASIRAKVGAALLSGLLSCAKIKVIREHPETGLLVSQRQPAFSRTSQLRKGKKVGMVTLNDELVTILKREPRGDFLAKHLPMVVEPEPWTKFDKGGYLESSSNLVRVKSGENKEQRLYTEAAIERGDLDQVLKGLDVLGKTAWRINTPVLNVMVEAWNTGEAIADIPPLNPAINVPPEPEPSDDPMVKRQWIRAVKNAENTSSGLHSVRCFVNFQLEIARAFRNQTFYFPHNVDFRGRAYPLPTYLNHMGADHVRGLLRFSKGKELGERGLGWLKVHLSNVFGFDKASLKEREEFAMANLDNILDSANHPLTGSRWWLKAEDPWQCLATCYELKAALELPDPTKYISHLPIHQDGTCNGLQHYAALGGDTWGARQVNLEPGERPADVYSAVANLVKESIAKDAAEDNPLAKVLEGKITRKVVKQTVMTNVYGVTFSGAKKQVCKQIDAAYPTIYEETGFDPMVLSSYIATLIFRALSTMFRGAHDIQSWLGEVGGRVCNSLTPDQLLHLENAAGEKKETKKKTAGKRKSDSKSSTDDLLEQLRSTIVWTTPLRMPVAQPYRKTATRMIHTCIQDLTLVLPDRFDPVNRRKQLQGFPPNFIHSLDASHMLLSALQCDDLGLTFAAVHDSFWTHAADIDTMNSVLRDSFIRIHEEDVIGRLAAEFSARYKDSLYLAKVKQNSPVGQQIKKYRKTAKRSLKEELLFERERQRLLQSADPEDVAKGRALETPASIYEEMASSDSLVASDEAKVQGLGVVADSEGLDADLEAASEADDGLVDSDETESSNDVAARLVDNMKRSHFEEQVVSGGSGRKVKAEPTIQIWLPLTFPPVPEKGDFDVRKLKGSQYFFS